MENEKRSYSIVKNRPSAMIKNTPKEKKHKKRQKNMEEGGDGGNV